ncbi:hypothetical protein TI05_18820, partial [Achromatium sp. WMS3]
SAEIKPRFRQVLKKLAKLVKKHNQTVVFIVGHTDNKGSKASNQKLSENRAIAVRDYFENQGIAKSRMHTEGRGEDEPITSNDTPEGRQANRRVEIYLRPIVKGKEAEAHESPHYGG